MKKLALFATMILALALSASASDMIDFTQMPPAQTPQPIPNPYHNLMWTAIGYVSVPLYESYLTTNGFDKGDGLNKGPEAQVAIIGGPLCYDKSEPAYPENEYPGTTDLDVCRGTISTTANALFAPDYLIASEGWIQDGHQFVTVEGYAAGKKIGSQKFDLGEDAKKFKLVLPDAWQGKVSELVLWPSPGGSVVLYVVHVK